MTMQDRIDYFRNTVAGMDFGQRDWLRANIVKDLGQAITDRNDFKCQFCRKQLAILDGTVGRESARES